MQNIVLIGMPGCGKSSIGRLLSKHMGKELIDMDDEIVKRAGITIPEIFQKYGEQYFRDLESEVAADLGKQRSIIIATGGGTILRPENVAHLKQNAIVVHILRDINHLATKGRPLSKDINTLKEMATVRMPLYKAAADVTYDNTITKSRENLVRDVLAALKGVL